MARCRHEVSEEPLTITDEAVACYLEERGRPRMAAFVRWVASREKEAFSREQDLRRDYNAIVDRLHAYEPPAKRVIPDYRPPAEASD